MRPLVITVAAVGAELTPDQTPHLPVTPEQLGETAALCRAAGAAMIHVHCRRDDGTNTATSSASATRWLRSAPRAI
ncbi:MAG: 3-keto-5-aminohexanoate cleavage protein [Candidatus Eremiobacteraeota bacterium]|nr:3-keto-5-aminohexanoate cleavage protein [Candidatus Eremiobacteraeota bacterium]